MKEKLVIEHNINKFSLENFLDSIACEMIEVHGYNPIHKNLSKTESISNLIYVKNLLYIKVSQFIGYHINKYSTLTKIEIKKILNSINNIADSLENELFAHR